MSLPGLGLAQIVESETQELIGFDDYKQDPDYEAGYAAGTMIAQEFGNASDTF